MRQKLLAILLPALLLVSCLCPTAALAAEEEDPEGWFSEHPEPTLRWELTREALEYDLDAETLGNADFGYELLGGDSSAYLLVELTGSGYETWNWESGELAEAYRDKNGQEEEITGYTYDAIVGVDLKNIPQSLSADWSFDEFIANYQDNQYVYDYEKMTIAGYPAIAFSMYQTFDEVETYEGGSVYDIEYWYYGHYDRHFYVLLGQQFPGRDLILSVYYCAEVYSNDWLPSYGEASAQSEVFHQKLSDVQRIAEEYLNADYTFTRRLITADDSAPLPTSNETNTGSWSYDTDAYGTGGTENSLLVPAAAVAILGGGAIAVGKKRKKKKSQKSERQTAEEAQTDDRSEDGKQDADEQEKVQYAMRIYKDFGDTLTAGAEPLSISARIVKLDPQGGETTDARLTSMIRISSPEYLQITNQQMHGEYKSALIRAPETEDSPESAVVEFTLQANGGRFTNRVHFKVEAAREIAFFQENLTLPALYDEVTMLPFAVTAKDDAEIAAVIEPAGSYEAEVEKGEEEGLYYVKIKELSKKEYTPGTVEAFTLHITVQSGKQKLIGSLPLYRFHMGFKVELGPAIGCHFELKDEVWMSGGKKLGEAKDYQPARTKVTMVVYDWDEEAHEVLVAAVAPGENEVQFTALEAENQEKLNKLGVKLLYAPDSATENGRNGIFVCTEAVLDPPTRFKAKLSIHTAFHGKEYTFEQNVVMASQKWRESKEIVEAAEKDQRTTEYLNNLRDSIESGEDLEHLFPLVKYIGILLDGYSETYGFNERQVSRIRDIYARYLRGELLGANAEAQTITFADELELFISAYIDTGATVEQSLGFWGNLAVGVISLGHSDAIFAAFKAAKAMKDYVARGGDSVWGAFYVGAASATADFAMSKVTDAATGVAVKGVKAAGKSALNLATKLSPKAVGGAVEAAEQAVKKTKEYLSDKVGGKIKRVLEKSGNEKAKVKSQVEKDIRNSNSKPMTAEEMRLEALESSGNKAAKVKMDDLEAARQVAERWPTTENMEFYRQKVLAVQQDKSAMYQLKNMDGADDLRKSFNREMKSIYENTDQRVRQYFESQGTPLKKTPQSATNSSAEALKKGQTVTMDRDVTYYAEDGGLLKQGEAQTAYERAFYKETKGIDPPSDDAAHAWAKLNDQSVVQKASGEHYGNEHDLGAMLKNHGEDLLDPNRVGKVVSDKGLEWMKEGQAMIEQGKAMADPKLGESLIENGLKLRKEGMRQITKQYKYVDARDISKACRSGKIQISEELRYGVEMFNNTLTDGPTHISVAKCESLLKEKGLTLEEVALALGRITASIG